MALRTTRGPIRVACCWCLWALGVWPGADLAGQAGPAASAAGARIAEAARVERAPRTDGTLDDPLWQQAQPVADFRQREPYEGRTPTEKTEVRILYTDRAVYFGIHCLDSEPKGIVATELRRDLPHGRLQRAVAPRAPWIAAADRLHVETTQRCRNHRVRGRIDDRPRAAPSQRRLDHGADSRPAL